MTGILCLNCGSEDAHTNCGALFCWTCCDELSEEEKDDACKRWLGEEKEAA